jgi:predicted nucleic acid-binding protein
MSKRLQVLLDEQEWREAKRIARVQRLTVAEWVRQMVRARPAGGAFLSMGRTRLSACDAIHYAVLEVHGITRILSLDGGFDGLPGIERLPA